MNRCTGHASTCLVAQADRETWTGWYCNTATLALDHVNEMFSEDGCLLGCSAVYSGRSLQTFQRSLLPPSSGRWGRWWRLQAPLNRQYTSIRLYGATIQQTAICNFVYEVRLLKNETAFAVPETRDGDSSLWAAEQVTTLPSYERQQDSLRNWPF
jgi:hypothetical protein